MLTTVVLLWRTCMCSPWGRLSYTFTQADVVSTFTVNHSFIWLYRSCYILCLVGSSRLQWAMLWPEWDMQLFALEMISVACVAMMVMMSIIISTEPHVEIKISSFSPTFRPDNEVGVSVWIVLNVNQQSIKYYFAKSIISVHSFIKMQFYQKWL